jgi:hypothetical protein
VIHQGDSGADFYVLLEGKCSIHVKSVGLVKVCAAQTQDCFFGELALLYVVLSLATTINHFRLHNVLFFCFLTESPYDLVWDLYGVPSGNG